MQVLAQAELPRESFSRTAEAPEQAAPAGLIYDLRQANGCSDGYYADVARFSEQVLAEIESRASRALDGYIQEALGSLREHPRSRGEYAIELLTLGQAMNQYAGAAEATPIAVIAAARALFWLRRFSYLKPLADSLRATLTRRFIVPAMRRNPRQTRSQVKGLRRLTAWMKATGEFEQEAIRIEHWRRYLATLPQAQAEHCIDAAQDLFDWFKRRAQQVLGPFTAGVPGFLSGEYARRGCREDQIFCGKEPVEYHLGMVAAEVMNQGLRPAFDRTPHRAVLVPACMRGAHAATCKAHVSGVDMTCAACDPECAVNRITRRMKSLGAQVYLVPHSTGFSRWLNRWQRDPQYGVTAVACMLNILPGGYEMRARGIASQCVPLDYPGCGKHWSKGGFPTAVNENRLVRISGPAPAVGA